MSMNEANLPNGWAACELDSVILKMSNGANVTQYEEQVGYPICRIETIWNEGIDLGRVKYIKENNAEFVEKHALQYGDILLSHINSDAHLGKTGLFKNQAETLIHGINILLLRPSKGISPEFLNYQLKHLRARGVFIDAAQRAVNQSSINQKKLKSFQIVVAPLNEQHRIVSKIEELFSELDKGIENLKTAREQLKVYRQALLKHAFEGKLTAQWREERRAANTVTPAQAGVQPNEKLDSRLRGSDKPLETAAALLARIQTEREQRYRQQLKEWEKSKSPSVPLLQRGKTTSAASTSTIPPFAKGGLGGISECTSKPKAPKPLLPLTAEELAELPELPEGWAWLKFGELTVSSQNGISKRNAETGREFVVLRLADITEQKITLDNSRKIKLTENEINNYSLSKDDLICIRVNGSPDLVGRLVSINEDMEIAYCDHFIRFKLLSKSCIHKYVQHFFNTHSVRRYVELNKVSSAGQNTVNQEMLSSVVVALCSLEEQKMIVELLEEKFSEVDQLELTLAASLQQAEALRQSILKKAFSGQLVAQDANDEPAAALLVRIGAEKATAMAKLHRRQKVTIEAIPAKTNVISFPVKIPNISATDLHAGILARAYQHHEYTPKYLIHFGHVKAEKIAHFVEAYLGIDLECEPIKDAAGPNDYPHLMKVESRACKANWFDVRKKKDGDAYEFSKKHGFDALLGKTMHALGERADEVDALIHLLLPMNKQQVEIVATLYAAWNNLLLLGQLPTDEEIVYEARENWNESKLKIERPRFFSALKWMREHGLAPAGKGRYVGAKAVRATSIKKKPVAVGIRKTKKGKAI